MSFAASRWRSRGRRDRGGDRPARLAADAIRRRPRAGCRRRRRYRGSRRCPARSSADATTWAEPGGVRSTTRLPERADIGHPVAHHPPEVILRGDAIDRVLGDGVDGLAARHPHLDRTEVVEVARHRGLGGDDALGLEQLDELGLAGDRRGPRAARTIRCWRCALLMVVPCHSLPRSSARRAGHGPRACGSRPGSRCGCAAPSSTSSTTSSPRWAGRQCRKMAPGGAHAHERARRPGSPRSRDAAARPRPPGPSRSRCRCRRRRRPATASSGRSKTSGSTPLARMRSRSVSAKV